MDDSMTSDPRQISTSLLSNLFLLILALSFAADFNSWAASSSVSLQWDASPSPGVTNYTIRYGTNSGVYSFTNNVGTNLIMAMPSLIVGTNYYFVVTATDSIGLESDPSNEIVFTGGNTLPVISDIIDQAVISGTSSGPIGFTVGDDGLPTNVLTLSAGSSDPVLVPVGNIVFSGSGSNRMVTVMPASGKSGMATIIISVSDGQLTTTTNFIVTVSPVASSSGVQIISPAYGTMVYAGSSILLAANATSPAGILKAEFFDGTTKLGEDLAIPYSLPISGLTEGVHNYSVRVIDSLDVTNTSSVVSVWVIPISPIPTVNLRSPVSGGQYIVADNLVLRAEAAAGTGITRVEFYEGEAKLGERAGSPYEVTVSNVLVGVHTYTARAFAANGMTNVSIPITVNVGFVSSDADATRPTLAITKVVQTTSGSVVVKGTGKDNRKLAQVIYSINNEPYRAVAGTTNWQIQANLVPGTNKLRIVGYDYKGNQFQTNKTLIYDNFVAHKGTYTGLAYDPNNVTFSNAGFFQLTLANWGRFSGKLLMAGGSYPFTGRFSVDGTNTLHIMRPGKPVLTGKLTLDLAGSAGISGPMSDGVFTVPLQADKAVFAQTNPAPYAGRYTMIVPRTGLVAGDGVGTVSMGPVGTVMLGGTLADGTVITRTAPVSGAGWWPLYVPLYAGKGMLISWVQFDTNGTKSLSGDAVWTKNPAPGRYYTNGFAKLTSVDGGQYVAPAVGPANRVLNLTNATVTLTRGNLATAITDSVVLANNNVLQIEGTNGLKLTINPANGMVNGSFTHPETKKLTAIKAVVQQGQTNFRGFFLGTNQSGQIILQP